MNRYFHLLSSNDAPDPNETSSIQGNIEARTSAIEDLEVQLQALDAQRRKVKEERDKLAAERRSLRGLLSPWRQIPPDIISEVMLVAVSQEHPKHRRVIVLSLVCRAWREVAVATPQLWENLRIDIGVRTGHLDDRKVSRWLGRSGSLPRTLELHWTSYLCAGNHTHAPEDCNLLKAGIIEILTSAPGLQRVIFARIALACFHSLADRLGFRQTSEDRESPLESLDVTIAPGQAALPHPSSGILYQAISYWSSLKALHLADLVHCPGQVLTTTGTLPFKNLISLVIGNCPMGFIAAALRACTSIQDLDLRLNYGPFTHASTVSAGAASHFLLPNLRKFRLECTFYDVAEAFLQILRTPLLVELTLSIDEDRYSSDSKESRSRNNRSSIGDSIVMLVEQSETTLHRLRLGDFSISSYGLQRILSKLPSLTHLTLSVITMDTNLFEPHADLQFLPRLQVLDLERNRVLEGYFPYDDVCNFFAARNEDPATFKVIHPLKTFWMEYVGRPSRRVNDSESLRAAVSRLRRSGVDVYTLY